MAGFLAIDQSTSATKALYFDDAGALAGQVAIAHEQIYPQPGWVEHDAAALYANTIEALRQLLVQHPEAGAAHSLSITNQRETFVIFDSTTGRPLHNAVVWQCRRGEPICRSLVEAGHEPFVAARTGLRIDTYFPASKLRHLLDARPELAAALADGSALFGTIDTYLIYRLTGGAIYATDHTNASRTLLYDIEALDWSADLCALFSLQGARLPEVRESAASFGATTLAGLLPSPLEIRGVMGDSQGALFAQRCFAPGSAKVTFGSGSSLLLTLGTELVRSQQGSVTTVGWVLNGVPTYALEGITNFTGATIAWLRDQLGLIKSAAETEELARSVADNGGVYLVPAFVGLSAPYWAPTARALITGLTPSSTRAHVVRAALESIAFVVTDALRTMEADAGLTLQYVHADGGAVRNRFLMQAVADISQRTVRAALLPELSALGAVYSAMVGSGIQTLDGLAALPGAYESFVPSLSPAEHETLWAGWQHAVAQALA